VRTYEAEDSPVSPRGSALVKQPDGGDGAPGRQHGEHQLDGGRIARNGSAVCTLTKHGIGAFSGALRLEVTQRHARVSLVESGATATELVGYNRPEVLQAMRGQVTGMQPMGPRTSRTRSPTS
jgi:NAD(P)-dependent dehydrogenase (short-subunit alcohol dehydrogenase family)